MVAAASRVMLTSKDSQTVARVSYVHSLSLCVPDLCYTLCLCAAGLGMENIGGIFVVLICGLIISVFVAIMEFVWSTRRSAETDEVNLHPPPPPPPTSSSSSCPAPGLSLRPHSSVGLQLCVHLCLCVCRRLRVFTGECLVFKTTVNIKPFPNIS